MFKFKNKGFTLIELLVVISIIALLSSVVLSALNVSRNKGADASVKAAMKQIPPQAELYRDTVQNFSGSVPVDATPTCTEGVFNEAKIQAMKAGVLVNAAPGATLTCFWDTATGARWAISVAPLRNIASWCVDNSGNSKIGTAQNTGICS